MTKLQRLYTEHGQSPWLDNLHRPGLRDGGLARMVGAGIRGVTANPTILAKAIDSSNDYDEQFLSLVLGGSSILDAYWDVVVRDVTDALAVVRPVFDDSGGRDGFVSVEVAPDLAHNVAGTIAAARGLHDRIDQPNLLVKIPATTEGVQAIEAMTASGRSINVTLIFSLTRYAQVIEAYLTGLETLVATGGHPSSVRSVASFFVSRVDTEVDARLRAAGHPEAAALSGRAGVAQAKLAYQLFAERFSGPRWQRLAELGANLQRPLWASTSTKNPAEPDTRYVDELIGPDTVTTLPEATIAAFEHHGTLARTIDTDVDESAVVIQRLAGAGVDMDDVGAVLETQAITAFERSFQDAQASLVGRALLELSA
jgi:transaldolase